MRNINKIKTTKLSMAKTSPFSKCPSDFVKDTTKMVLLSGMGRIIKTNGLVVRDVVDVVTTATSREVRVSMGLEVGIITRAIVDLKLKVISKL